MIQPSGFKRPESELSLLVGVQRAHWRFGRVGAIDRNECAGSGFAVRTGYRAKQCGTLVGGQRNFGFDDFIGGGLYKKRLDKIHWGKPLSDTKFY